MHLSWKTLRRLNSYPLTDRKPDDIIAYCAAGGVKVDHFLARANALSSRLPRHRYVINLCSDRYHYLLGFCAAVIAGQATLMPPNRQPQTLKQVAEEYPDSYSLGDDGQCDFEITTNDIADIEPGSRGAAAPEIPCDQLCVIAFTSGSTGAPLPNLKYWETLRAGAIADVALLTDEESHGLALLATVPPPHMWGFEACILLPLFVNVAVSNLAPFYPQDIADALQSLPAPRALISSPVHLDALRRSGLRLPRLQKIFAATSPLSREQAQELEDQFDTSLLEAFGCSESGIMAVRNTSSETLWRFSGVFDLDVKEDRVIVRAKHLPEDVVLPDRIELTGDNQFRWLGRRQDMINIAGKRGSVSDLNHRLNAIPGVIDGIIFMREDNANKLAALVVAPGLEPSDILGALKPQIEPVFVPRPVYMVAALPRQETGKMSKKMVMELFEETKMKKMSDKKTDTATSGDAE
jgi:acyl-coenzyme A synthetase/AMP-(fatty) acid ligase